MKIGEYVSVPHLDVDLAEIIAINTETNEVTIEDYDTQYQHTVEYGECEPTICLANILSSYKYQKFYSPLVGWCILEDILADGTIRFDKIELRPNGKFHRDGIFAIFPNNDYACMVFDNKNIDEYVDIWRDYTKNNDASSPCWEDLVNSKSYTYATACINSGNIVTAAGKGSFAALALMKIKQLIDKYYGGIMSVTDIAYHTCYYIDSHSHIQPTDSFQHIAFCTKEYAENFLKNEKNVKLLNEFYS